MKLARFETITVAAVLGLAVFTFGLLPTHAAAHDTQADPTDSGCSGFNDHDPARALRTRGALFPTAGGEGSAQHCEPVSRARK